MVVIRGNRSELMELYGSSFPDNIKSFSRVIGFTVEEYGDDIKVEFNPDRPDLFAFSQLKTAIDTYYSDNHRVPDISSKPIFRLQQDASTYHIRRYILGFSARGPKIGRHFNELIEFQEKIHQTIGKDRLKVSIGLHDSSNLTREIIFKGIEPEGISFTTYDGLVSGNASKILKEHPKGIEYSHLLGGSRTVTVLLDSNGHVLSMPPVINGDFTKVTPDTRNFFADITGTEISSVRNTLYLLAYYFANLGYSINLSFSDEGLRSRILPFDKRKVVITRREVQKTLGLEIPLGEATALLRKMGIGSSLKGNSLLCEVPGNRVDVMGPADIAEEIAKAFGYNNVRAVRPKLSIIGKINPETRLADETRAILLGMSIQEVMSYVVSSKSVFSIEDGDTHYRILNPKSEDFSVIRSRLYPNLLEFLRINKRSNLPQEIFEVGYVIQGGNQRLAAAVVSCGTDSDYSRIRGILDAFSQRIIGRRLTVLPSSSANFIEGRYGQISLERGSIGIIGELHPLVLNKFDLSYPVALWEMCLDSIEISGSL
ncbi:MAG TPA: phenylalanine--tRNA ligase subunit beta [Thermoplasmataceae archaeon]|nr:phenylalanine--tRNA ligase subunit beta [Thermoplasmataceae archaeon]